MHLGNGRIGFGGLVIGLVLGLVGGGFGRDVGQQRLHRQLVVIIGHAAFEGGAGVLLVLGGLFGDQLHVDEVVERILLARRPVELLRQARPDIQQSVVDVFLGYRRAVDFGEDLGFGVGALRREKKRAQAQRKGDAAMAKR